MVQEVVKKFIDLNDQVVTSENQTMKKRSYPLRNNYLANPRS